MENRTVHVQQNGASRTVNPTTLVRHGLPRVRAKSKGMPARPYWNTVQGVGWEVHNKSLNRTV